MYIYHPAVETSRNNIKLSAVQAVIWHCGNNISHVKNATLHRAWLVLGLVNHHDM